MHNASPTAYERALLSICLADPAARSRIAMLPPDAFAESRHGVILAAMREVEASGDLVTAVTVGMHLLATGKLAGVDVADYMAAVAGDPGGDPRRLEFLVERATDQWARREIAEHLGGAVASLGQPETPVDNALVHVRTALERAAKSIESPFQPLGTMAAKLETLFREGPKVASLRTGLPDLDHILGGGLAPERLYFIGAPTGAGKSSLALQIAHEAAKAARIDAALGAGVLYISLELTSEETAIRLISQAQPVAHGYRRSSGWAPADLPLAMQGLEEISGLPLYCLEPSGATMDAIRSQVDSFSALVGRPALVVVDYIGLVSAAGARSTLEAVTDVTRALKRMSRSLKIPVLALAQLNRESMKRDDHRPKTSDLRDSGSIEHDGDVVIFLHSDHFFLDPARQAEHVGPVDVEIIVAKNRMGSRGAAAARWIQHRYLYLPVNPDAASPPAWAATPSAARPSPRPAPELEARVLEAVGELERTMGRPAKRTEVLGQLGIAGRPKWQDTPIAGTVRQLVADERLVERRDGTGKLAGYTYAIPPSPPPKEAAAPAPALAAPQGAAAEQFPELDDDAVSRMFG